MTKEIGLKLQQLRKNRRMTQEDVSNAVNNAISRSTISNYEIGRRTPHLKELQLLASVFGVGIDYFGVNANDNAFDLIARAKEVFSSEDVSAEAKEALYLEFLRLYIDIKDGKKQ